MAHPFNPSTGEVEEEAEAGRSLWVGGQPCTEFQASQLRLVKKQNNNNKNPPNILFPKCFSSKFESSNPDRNKNVSWMIDTFQALYQGYNDKRCERGHRP